MILLIDSSTPTCHLTYVDGDTRFTESREAGRSLSKDLHSYIRDDLKKMGRDWSDIEAIGAFRGPGSYTGLRIGLTVVNTLADAKKIPIVGASGDNWQDEALARLEKGENDQIILPEYSGDANITKPRK